MPGPYLHMEIVRKAMAGLAANPSAAAVFASGPGPSAQTLQDLATDPANLAYLSLGAVGPDFFIFLPDFKRPYGNALFPAAQVMMDFYLQLDATVLGPYEQQLGPIGYDQATIDDALSGGLDSRIKSLKRRALTLALETAIVAASTQYDVWGILGSGLPSGYDEQAFFWSDMLHYRKTSEFAIHLWQKADGQGSDRLRAYALGWMSHVAGDTTGHAFVNQKTGGPFRLHWQRHHVVENHMDGQIYEALHGGGDTYRMLADAALHRWIAFEDGTGDSLDPQPPFDAVHHGDRPEDIRRKLMDRHEIWDVDSQMPDDLANFLADALKSFFSVDHSTAANGQLKDHPTIIEDYDRGSGGFPSAQTLKTTYWWLFHYLKRITTDIDLYEPPEPPLPADLIVRAPFPEPPAPVGSSLDPLNSPGAALHDAAELAFGVVGWLQWLNEVPNWIAATAAAPVIGGATFLPRWAMFLGEENPLYNALLSLHWYMAMTGFAPPLRDEVNPGLHTLGQGVAFDESLIALLSEPFGGLDRSAPPPGDPEESGRGKDRAYPRDCVTDPPAFVESKIRAVLDLRCGEAETPSEFLRPWLYPEADNNGNLLPTELLETIPGPYRPGDDALTLLGGLPGDNAARTQFERAGSEAETVASNLALLPLGRHLGDPVDYTAYLVARLTRDAPDNIANFNLDADRSYGQLCWDWVRSDLIQATPAAWKHTSQRIYNAPLRPGFGWCDQEVIQATVPPATDAAHRPAMHDSTVAPSSPGQQPVRVRYLDHELKF